MDSDDFSLIDIGHEDDSLLRNLPPDEAGGFTCSPLVIAGSAASSRADKTTISKDNVRLGETGCMLPDSNKENLKASGNMKLGSINLSMEPQKMKRNRKAGGCNLRKSLAWDKAFFTEEGVLSSLELSMISGTPSKLDGKYFPVISEEQRTPLHSNATPTNLQNIESKSSRKLPPRSTMADKRTRECSILKQKSLASGSLKSKKLASTTSAMNCGRKEGSCLNDITPTSHKRLLSSSPAKPAAQSSKIPRIPVLKPNAQLISTAASSSDASHLKRSRIAPPASVHKHLGQKGCSNTRSTSNPPKVVAQRIPKPSKPSDQRNRKSRTVPSSREQSNVYEITPSEVNSGKISPIGPEANGGTSKAAVLAHTNSGNTCSIGQSVQLQAAKPSGLRMPSPSLRFFSEPKIPMPNGLGQRNIKLGTTSDAFESKIPKATMDRFPGPGPVQQSSVSSISHNQGTRRDVIQSRIPKAAMDRASDSGPVQPCPVTSINSPKIHDEYVQCKKNELIDGVQALLDEKKPLEQIGNSFEEVGKHFLEQENTSPSIEGVDDKGNRSVSPIGECEYNDTNLFRSSDQFKTSGMEQYDLLAMNKGLGQESEVREYANLSFAENTNETDLISPNVDFELQMSPWGCKSISQVDAVVCEAELSSSPASLGTKPQSEEIADPSVAEYTNETNLVGQNADFENIVSPKVCKCTSQVDAVLCDATFSPIQGLASTEADLSKYGINQQHDISDELVRETLMPEEATSTSLMSKVSSTDLIVFEDIKLRHRTEFQLSQSTISVERLMLDEATSGSSENEHQEGLVSVDDRELSCQAEFQLNPCTFEDQTVHAAPFCILSLENETMSVSVEKDKCEKDLSASVRRESIDFNHKDMLLLANKKGDQTTKSPAINNTEAYSPHASVEDRELSDQAEFQLNPSTFEDQTVHAAAFCIPSLENETMSVSSEKEKHEIELVASDRREMIEFNHTDMFLLANRNEDQTANSPAINSTEAYCPHASVDLSIPLKATRHSTIGVDELENYDQMNQETPNPSLESEPVENHAIVMDDSSSRNDTTDQTILKELQLPPRMSEDCTISCAADCDILLSRSPCESMSTTVRKASMDESDELFESADQHEDIHYIDNEDENARTRLTKNANNQAQLVIRPPADVAPFSDEWLAAVEAAGEEILTLKTGPVQNSPPAKFSPEPSPWSPVKRKNNQGIGPYDCTKFNTGQQ